jgi:UDPglucose--hexose-1-phosphate uridylyltransferase
MKEPAARWTLADGRELLLFALPGHTPAPVPDRRPLPERGIAQSQLRFDRQTGQWVIIAALRQDRTYKPPPEACPLCPGPSGLTSEIPAPDYDVAVFENRFPSLSGAGTAPFHLPPVNGDLFSSAPGHGRCEVICFSSDHTGSFSQLELPQARLVVDAWRHRTADLMARPGIAHVFCFENRGEEIGVTLTHPHGQIYAYPYLPARTQSLLRHAGAHRAATGGSLLADVLADEQRADVRMVLRGEQWSAYVPLAAKWPLELILAPHRDVRDLAELTGDERAELAVVYLDLLRRVDRFFPGVDRTPYISAWHQAPVGEDRELGRLHLQLFSVMRAPGRLKFLAGSESALGAWINDTTPERIARRLREVAES